MLSKSDVDASSQVSFLYLIYTKSSRQGAFCVLLVIWDWYVEHQIWFMKSRHSARRLLVM